QLDGDRPIQLRVERAVDDAHAARAERGLHLIRADSMASWERRAGAAHEACRHIDSRFREKYRRRGRLSDQRLDLTAQPLIAGAGVPEKLRPVACVTRKCRVIELLDPPPALACHGDDGAVSRLYAPSEIPQLSVSSHTAYRSGHHPALSQEMAEDQPFRNQ